MNGVVEREWKSIRSRENESRTMVMCEWDGGSRGGRNFKRTLKQIDCRHPRLAELGGGDCQWECEGVIGKREK